VSTIFAWLFREIDVSRARRVQYNSFVTLVTLDVSNLHFERECMSYLFETRDRERERERERGGEEGQRGIEKNARSGKIEFYGPRKRNVIARRKRTGCRPSW